MIYKYDYLLDDRLAEKFFSQNSIKIFNQEIDIKVLESKRADNYNRDSYNILFKILIGSDRKEIRVSGQSYLSKKVDYSIMNFYYQHGFNGGNILVPKPLVYLNDYNLLVYENIGGITLLKEVEAGEKNITSKVELSAKALKKIHELPKPDIELWDKNTLYKFEEYEKKAIGKFYPDLSHRIGEIIASIKQNVEAKTSNEFCHGDFQPNNLIYNNDKLYVIDFGTSCFLDKEYDVATFVCQFTSMMSRYGDGIDTNALIDLFKKTYGRFNQEKFVFFSALVNLRTLGVYCVFSDKMDNLKHIPLIYGLLETNLKNIGMI